MCLGPNAKIYIYQFLGLVGVAYGSPYISRFIIHKIGNIARA